MNIHFHTSTSLLESELLSPSLSSQLKGIEIPSNAKRITLNLRAHRFYSHQQGHPPVEIHLERACETAPWQIIIIACFGFTDETYQKLDVDLYFNLKRGWVYQPFAQQCNLIEPSSLSLLLSFSNALAKNINNQQFDELTALVTRNFL